MQPNYRFMFEYNTERNALIIKEYGRNIQKMIEDAVKIKDRKRRNETAKAIVRVMSMCSMNATSNGSAKGNIPAVDANKKMKDSIEFWQKLWDHLFIISNYQLDVDSPFPKPTPESRVIEKVGCGNLSKSKITVRTYGRYIEKIIKTVANYPDSERKIEITKDIANNMKKLYLTWNRDTVDDKVIAQHLSQLSNGRLTLPRGFEFNLTQDIIAKNNLYAAKTKISKNSRRKKKKHKTNVETV